MYKYKDLFGIWGKIILLFCSSAWSPKQASAQFSSQVKIDSMVRLLPGMKNDTNKCKLLNEITISYSLKADPRGVSYGYESGAVAKKLAWRRGMIEALSALGTEFNNISKLDSAFKYEKASYALAVQFGDRFEQEQALVILGNTYSYDRGNYTAALSSLMQASRIAVALKNKDLLSTINSSIGRIYYLMGDGNKALPYHFKMLAEYQAKNLKVGMIGGYIFIGEDYMVLKNYDKAIFYLASALRSCYQNKMSLFIPQISYDLSDSYMQKNNYRSAYAYIDTARHLADVGPGDKSILNTKAARFYVDAPDTVLRSMGIDPASRYHKALAELTAAMKIDTSDHRDLREKYLYLYHVYQHLQNYKMAFYTSQRYIALKDSLAASDNDAVKFTEKMAGYDAAKKEEAARYQRDLANIRFAQQKKYYLFGVMALAIISFFIFFNYFNQRKANQKITQANHQLSEQQEEITVQRDRLAETVNNLKSTQTQLIQAEKMASLGELTAGIAHEIQNPLNFVNNFSEVNREMIGELEEELRAGNVDEALAIAADIKENEAKINHHGKRADGIVKGMLEHSRSSTGIKEPTDLNKLADEYLRLAYNGLRAKDKSFNADLVTNFDETLPLVNIIPQDMGRVLLNLFNNAFYAVKEKAKTAGENYKPEVKISTMPSSPPPAGGGRGIAFSVSDNGSGIPDAIKDKIMQPFFTTKPTGQGTGLGLSLSYDIIVKGHGGAIDVKSVAGEGSEFVIGLPA